MLVNAERRVAHRYAPETNCLRSVAKRCARLSRCCRVLP